jgi:cytochrome c oxidase subunit 2
MRRLFVPLPIVRLLTALASLTSLNLLTGCWLDGPQSTFDVKGPVARAQLHVFHTTLWVTAFIFVVVGSVLAYATWRFRVRPGAEKSGNAPPQGHGNPWIELGLVGASVLCLVVIAVPTLRTIWFTYDAPLAGKPGAYPVNATGYQWWFKFEYPEEQIDGAGPLVTGNELVIPAGRPVRIQLRTMDVIHSFWVPKLAGKVDMIPNRANHLWLKADEPGYFYGQCAEFCGDSHAIMRFRVIALSESEFAVWVKNQKRPARAAVPAVAADEPARPRAQFASLRSPGSTTALAASPEFDAAPLTAWRARQAADPATEDGPLIAEGRRLFQQKTCIACHTIRGHEGVGIIGPDLTHVGARTTIAAGTLENTPERMHDWIADPNHFKPGNKMYNGGYVDLATGRRLIDLREPEIKALVAYLQSLK